MLPLFSAEIQLALDKDNTVFTLDKKLATKTNLINQFPNLHEARIFLTEDEFILEVTQEIEGKLSRTVRNITDSELVQLREEVTKAVYERKPNYTLDNTGKVELLGGTLLLSAAYYSWSIPHALDLKRDVGTSVSLLTISTGFFLPFMLTKNKEISTGAASLALYGGSRGIFHGYALLNAFDSDYDSQTGATISTVLSITELWALYNYASKNELTAGQSDMIGTYGDIFLLWGAGFAQYNSKDNINLSSTTEMMFGGNIIGMLSGSYIGKSGLYTRGDTFILRGSTLLGGYAGVAIALLSDMDLYDGTLLSILSSSIGLYAGDKLVKDYDFNAKEGILTNLGMLGGALIGSSIGVLTVSHDDIGILPVLTVLGGGIGFSTLANYYKNNRLQKKSTASNFQFNLNPMGAMALMQNSNNINRSIINMSIDF